MTSTLPYSIDNLKSESLIAILSRASWLSKSR